MNQTTKHTIKRLALISMSLMLLLAFAVACGGSDAEESSEAAPAAAAPTAAPAASSSQPETSSSAERVTVVVADLEEERVFPPLSGGADLKYLRVYMEDMFAPVGKGQLVPGIISKLEMSDDGTTWTIDVNTEIGIKFHD